MKKIAVLLLPVLILCLTVQAFPPRVRAEAVSWSCPDCGQTGNTGKFCPDCGVPKPSAPDVNEDLRQIPGETDRVAVSVHRIDGSSFIVGKKNKFLYAPENALRDDPASCWRFSAKKGLKDKAWLSLIIEGGTVDGIRIRNGFQYTDSKGKDQYPLYARLKDIRVMFEYCNDENSILSFTLPDGNYGWDELDTGRQEDVYSVILFIDSVYKGKPNANTVCLSEVMLIRNAPADSALPPL